ncbi:NF-E2 inducible protein-like [Heracleum sosnowskyi]|uniref:NF-E2 inducible protein-like n=1 Tax=Heracleum sosnowskyi TaxID=360622 RepID=A0AAD8HXS3_9APIA|nr:NF-E2 inducible protein-like [Heracleum sosnowskyi]
MNHKIKTIQFFGRTTPIILQNDNGPCPLLAICNVLLLKNNLNLSLDVWEISQERLLSLVAETRMQGMLRTNNRTLADAIDLLPRLTTGIDVNIKFKGITEFEFTRECAIFDLLDIPLYHGWIVDPQKLKARKGDIEEETELLRAMKLSEAEVPLMQDNHQINILILRLASSTFIQSCISRQ